jgi:hypothetical protein
MAVMQFSTTKLQLSTKKITATEQSFIIGQEIAQDLNAADLQAIFILSDGLNINGSLLTEGLSSVLPPKIKTSGALGGDNEEFVSTWIVVDGKAVEHYVSAIGFYGENIRFGHASKDGLDKFGVQRVVTRSKDNILYELDKKPALELYKKYLRDKAEDLPASGLYFPISVENEDYKEVIRTILAVNHKENSITFAGDVPEGSYVTFMKANYDRIIDAATEAASKLLPKDYNGEAVISIAASCVGRKLTLRQRVEEELEAMLEILPNETLQIGLYSYGEISPTAQKCCELHNQTMTLTTIWEKDA